MFKDLKAQKRLSEKVIFKTTDETEMPFFFFNMQTKKKGQMETYHHMNSSISG